MSSHKRYSSHSKGVFGQTGTNNHKQSGHRAQTKQWRNKPVCLDYLKGICHEKRWKCNYAHPPLQSNSKRAEEDIQVCEVWVLTGSCKFGENCRDYHPTLSEHTLCAPAKVPRQKSWTSESSDSACGSSCGSGSDNDFTPSSTLDKLTPTVTINVQELSLEQVVKKVNGILNKLTPEKFDSLLQQLFAIVAADNSEAYMERVVPLIFAKAIAEVKISSLYATLTRHLYGLVGAEERPAVLRQLLQLSDRLIFEIADIVSDLSVEQAQKLQAKRSGNVKFLAELHSEGVIPADEVIRRLNYLLECAHGSDSEAVFCTQLVCELLTLIGDTLPWASVSPIMQTLPAVAARHSPRVQFLVWNLLELKGVKPSPTKPAIKIEVAPTFASPMVAVEQSSFPRTPSSTSESPVEHSPFLTPSDTTSFCFCYDPYSPNLYRTPYPR